MRRDDTPPRSVPLSRGGPLDALRFLAAFFMVLHHYAVDAPARLETAHPILGRGYLATDFFLIVSGYVLGRIYGDRVADGMKAGPFLTRRAWRVVPAHLMVAAAFIALVLATSALGIAPTHPRWFDWSELPQQILLVQSWGVFGGGRGWNAPVWSLSALLVCYLTFPSLWRGLRRIQSPALVMALGLAGLAIADLVSKALIGLPIYSLPMHFGIVRAAPLFLLGVTLALVAETAPIPRATAVALGLSSVALLAMVQTVSPSDYVSLCLIALIVLSAGAVPVRRPSKVLEKAALISFALFITNELVRVAYYGAGEVAVRKLGLGPQAQWAIWFGGPVAAVVLAVAFHYLIDWPSQTWIKARLDRGGLNLTAKIKAWLAALPPRPDPRFDPLVAEAQRMTQIREVPVHAGPLRGGF